MFLPNGSLKIIDRKKNIFKLAQGEYVAPEKIENVYSRSMWVAQCFVWGDSFKTKLVAVVVPDPDVVLEWAKKQGKERVTFSALCKDIELKDIIRKSLTEVGASAKLQGFETVKAFYIDPEPFSVENDLLTPTFKLKRPQAVKKYKDIIATMYAELGE